MLKGKYTLIASGGIKKTTGNSGKSDRFDELIVSKFKHLSKKTTFNNSPFWSLQAGVAWFQGGKTSAIISEKQLLLPIIPQSITMQFPNNLEAVMLQRV